MSPGLQKRIKAMEEDIGYEFADKTLAVRALTHSSYSDSKRGEKNYERLEFLGDRVLGLLTAEKLFLLDNGNEGSMARRLNALVRKEACARVARKANLGTYMLISPSEEKQGGRDKTSILGDICEAVLGAIYLDGGLASACEFYNKFWRDEFKGINQKNSKDPKTELQEKSAQYGFGLPRYNVVERTGPDHRPMFVIEVEIEGVGKAKGTGKSKKLAERYAAQHLLENWPDDK